MNGQFLNSCHIVYIRFTEQYGALTETKEMNLPVSQTLLIAFWIILVFMYNSYMLQALAMFAYSQYL